MVRAVFLSVIVFFVGGVSGSYKRWLPDTNFENPNNWNVKRAPCGNDVAIIPDDSPVVYVQFNTTVKELVLPKNGELILGLNVGLGFTQSPVAGCADAGGDVEFTAVHPEPWLDPTSWCTTPTQTGNCDVSQMTLDVEKVPCGYDDVIFPRDHSYFVDLSEDTPTLSVKSLKIAGSSFTTSTLTTFFSSDYGQRMFRLPSGSTGTGGIDITRRDCDDVKGCACGNDRPEIASKICAYATKRCTRPRCTDTIQPLGACCRMCGVLFNFTRGYGFNFESFKTNMKNKFFSDGTNSDVNMTSSVTSAGWVQLVLADDTGERSKAVAKQIAAEINNDLSNGGHTYAVDSFQMSFSTGTPISPSTSAHQGGSMGGGSIAGIVLAIVVVIALIIIVVVFVFRRTGREIPKLPSIHMPHMPSLPRLPRRTPKATARVPPGVFSQPQTAAHIDPGFANPLYDTSPFDDGNAVVKEMELIEAREEQPTFDVSDAGFNNPLYGTQGGSMFSDPTKTDDARGSPASIKKGVTVTSSSGAKPQTDSDTAIIIEHGPDHGDSNI